MVSLRLLHAYVKDDVGVEEGGDDVHLLDFHVVMISKDKEYAKSSISYPRGKDICVVEVLHVATSDETGLVLDNTSGAISLKFVFLGASNDLHGGDERNKCPCVLVDEASEFFVGSGELVSVV
jgi:hypothetical protein